MTALPVSSAAEQASFMEVVLRRVSSATFVGRSGELEVLDAAGGRVEAAAVAHRLGLTAK